MWYNRSLRTRILLGYGLILALASALALFLVLHVSQLNRNMQRLNQSVATETDVGIHMTRDVAEVQQAVSRYLQQPQPAHLRSVQESLHHLTIDLEQMQARLIGSGQQASLTGLKHQLQIYHSTFESVGRLIKEQTPILNNLNTHLSRASTRLNTAITSDTNPALISQLSDAQTSLQQASVAIVRLTNAPSEEAGTNAIAELNEVSFLLKSTSSTRGSPTSVSIGSTLSEISIATDLTRELIQSIEQVQQQRDTELAKQGNLLKQRADEIAQRAMNNLSGTAVSLAAQTYNTQRIAVLALLITLLIVLLVGIGMAHTITQPVQELVTATARLAQGDYDVTVAQTDKSEIGQLAAVFNQLTTTLRQQRAEVVQQQEAIVSRNQELEQALAELRTATEARNALDVTVRSLSVPVVPILDNVIVVPLVGEISQQRAHALLLQLLDGITKQHASIAILDITGVPFVDTSIVELLLSIANAAGLLGARCVLVGIRPEVAQAMVASGASLAGLDTKATLRDAVEHALQLRMYGLRSSLN